MKSKTYYKWVFVSMVLWFVPFSILMMGHYDRGRAIWNNYDITWLFYFLCVSSVNILVCLGYGHFKDVNDEV